MTARVALGAIRSNFAALRSLPSPASISSPVVDASITIGVQSADEAAALNRGARGVDGEATHAYVS